MADNGYGTRNESGAAPGAGDRRTTLACCPTETGDGVAGFPCAAIARRHPVIVSVIVTLMGLACLVIATTAIVGVLRCIRAA